VIIGIPGLTQIGDPESLIPGHSGRQAPQDWGVPGLLSGKYLSDISRLVSLFYPCLNLHRFNYPWQRQTLNEWGCWRCQPKM